MGGVKHIQDLSELKHAGSMETSNVSSDARSPEGFHANLNWRWNDAVSRFE